MACRSHKLLSLTELVSSPSLYVKERSFLRVIMHHDYEEQQRYICAKQVRLMAAHPTCALLLTLFDYSIRPTTDSPLSPVLHAVGARSDMVARVERSGGGLQPHLLQVLRWIFWESFALRPIFEKDQLRIKPHACLRGKQRAAPYDIEHTRLEDEVARKRLAQGPRWTQGVDKISWVVQLRSDGAEINENLRDLASRGVAGRTEAQLMGGIDAVLEAAWDAIEIY
ncbi:hypothetical protein B0H17DRAFT_1213499 [Mycena rosella]|uniref:Uncharacterized protein n=1 Tax=Mycena rosella TaxID=1033263 RepID=A0AAD7CQV0_MYCRO|nr:hypothetical protein B0H17DRAFT_1213499 [Mycena rosella]